jgi:hypothetical protein
MAARAILKVSSVPKSMTQNGSHKTTGTPARNWTAGEKSLSANFRLARKTPVTIPVKAPIDTPNANLVKL